MKRIRSLLILPLIATLLAGCPFSPKVIDPIKPSLYPPQTSPKACLTILQKTYQDRNDATEYRKLFASDYTFKFSPNDVSGPNPTPAQWGLAEEIESTENMFNSELVTSISLTFVDGDPVQSDLFPGTWKVEMTSIQLRLETRKPDGSPLTVAVENGHCIFYFKEFPDEPTPTGPIWRIWRWEDQGLNTSQLLAAAPQGKQVRR